MQQRTWWWERNSVDGRTVRTVGSRSNARIVAGLWILCLSTVSGCGLGLIEDSTEDGDPPNAPPTKAPPTYEMNAGNIVARFETEVPAGDTFLLHGTLPVPPGQFFPGQTTIPVAVIDTDGSPVVTQVEVVSRYANSADGADVVEVIAQVTRPETADVGDRVQYELTVLDAPVPNPTTTTSGVQTLIETTASLPGSVVGLLSTPAALELVASDVFGHVYKHRPLEDGELPQLRKYGYNASQVRTYGAMLPVAPVSGDSGTHPHLFGVHAYITALREEAVVLLDLRVHNGFANTDYTTAADDVLGSLYFDKLELAVPAGWAVVQCFEDSGLGTPYGSGGKGIFPLVAAQADGKLHFMPMGGQMIRRLALCPVGEESRAREILDQEGLAFAVPGFDLVSEQDTWSWSSPFTPRFGTQNVRLPSLEHANLAYIRSLHSADFQELLTNLENGTGDGGYPLANGKLGWAHPYGVAYGGMTGGKEIHLFEGVDTVQARSKDGYRHYQLVHRMHTDRQPNVLYRRDGQHASLWDWYVENGENSYVPLVFYMKYLNGPDPIGVSNPPTFQSDAAIALGKVPDYAATLGSYDPHDLQHLIRYTRSPKALVWIGNDNLAKDDLFAQAELVRMTYHPFYSDPYGNKVVTGMRADIDQTEQNPGGAIDFGRGEGWATDTRVAAYALADDAWRALEYPMLETMVDMLAAGQVPCTGHIMAFWSSKILDGKYRCAQAYETSIVDNSIIGLLETVFRGQSASMSALTEAILRDNYYGFIAPTAWNSELNGPVEQYAVSAPDNLATPYCNLTQQPADGQFPGVNTYQTWCTLAYAYQLTGDPIFLQRADEMIGGELLMGVMNDGIDNIQNRAALLSLMQELNEIL